MAEYNVKGHWKICQTNGCTASFDIQSQQPNGKILGTAIQGNRTVVGAVYGELLNDQFVFIVTWNNNTQGKYIGQFYAQGRLVGATFDAKNPGSYAGWESLTAFTRHLQEPEATDAVLGTEAFHPGQSSSAVLGGLEGLKQRLLQGTPAQRIVGLQQAMQYGKPGIDMVTAALADDAFEVRQIAYQLLQESSNATGRSPTS
ncbi:MAG TPA: hypothetical protein V6C78_00260 [Crinalium sp.]|jgi:hypothetical protein